MTGLILIDIQNDYFPGGKMELSGSEQAALAAKDILDIFRKNKLPVFHIQHFSTKPGATFFIPNTIGVEINAKVKPAAAEKVIAKNFPNSFRNTELKELLDNENVDKLVICGMMTHMCIDATTRAAFDLGYECILIKDACATRDLPIDGKNIPAEHVHLSFIAALGSVYAKILSKNDYIKLVDNNN